MSEENLREKNFREVVLNGALENFLQSGHVSPVLLAVRPDDSFLVLPCGPLMEDKAKLAKVIEDARMHLPLVAFVTESWMVKGKDLSVQPKDHPDREEVVMVVFYQGMKAKVVLAKIHRPVGCSPHLGDGFVVHLHNGTEEEDHDDTRASTRSSQRDAEAGGPQSQDEPKL